MAALATAGQPHATERPVARAGIEITEGFDGRAVAYNAATGRYTRLGRDLVSVLGLLDGTRSVEQVGNRLPGEVPIAAVANAIQQLGNLGFLEDPASPQPPPARRLSFRPPCSVQFGLLDPTALLNRGNALIDRLCSRWFLVVVAALSTVGVVVGGLHAGLLVREATQPISAWTALAVLVTVVAVTCVHELAHAAVLHHFGGRVRRMGVMLFYFTPACFCDVSDAWRLPSRKRALVAAAGIGAQSALGALAFLALAVVPSGASPAVSSWLALSGSASLIMALVNGLPFVKLDGYLVLMSLTDVSNLRRKAMTAFRRRIAGVVLGTAAPAPTFRFQKLTLAYGGIAALFGPALVLYAAVAYSPIVVLAGPVGEVAWLAGCAVVVALIVVRLTRRTVRHARLHVARPIRALAGMAVAASALGLVAAVVHVPSTVTSSYVIDQDGRVLLALGSGVDVDDLARGGVVRLKSVGLLGTASVGKARVGLELEQHAKVCRAPASPIASDGLFSVGPAYVLTDLQVRADAPRCGVAVLRVRQTSLLQSAIRFLAGPALKRL